MNDDRLNDDRLNERIVNALRRRPADEPAFERPLRLPARGEETAEPLTGLVPSLGLGRADGRRPAVRSRTPIRALPALALALALLVVAVMAFGPGRQDGPAVQWAASASTVPASAGSDGLPTFEPTGKVGCFGQAPGIAPAPGISLGCPVMAVPPDGLSAATWTLDSAFPFSASMTELHVLAHEWECASGRSAVGRIAKNLALEKDRVVITLAVRPPEGDIQTCQGNPETPVVVSLGQPVGERTLFDGGTYPATPQAASGEAIVTPSPTPTPSNWHQPMDCAGVNQDADLGGFFKRVSMDLPFDVYCPVLPAGWTAKPGDGGQAGIETDGWIRTDYQGPNGQTFELMQGAFCEAASSMICDRIAGPSGTAELGGRSAKLGGAGDRWFAYTAPESGAMWEADGTGMTRDEFLALLATLVVVAK